MKRILVLSMAAAIVAPAISAPAVASAESCREQTRHRATNGTIIGGLGGALLGSAVAGHGSKTGGALVGGAVGAVAGHEIGKKGTKCRAYRQASPAPRYAPRRISNTAPSSASCRWVQEYYGGRNHSYQVCRDRDGVWRPS